MDQCNASPAKCNIVEASQELHKAGQKTLDGWKELSSCQQNDRNTSPEIIVQNDESFHELYLELMTEAFGEELDSLRGNNNEQMNNNFNMSNNDDNYNDDSNALNCKLMTNCLESGVDVFDSVVKI